MGYIHCCGGIRKCRTFELNADKNFVYKVLNFLELCPICGHTVVQLTRLDVDNKVSVYRLTNKKAKKFFEKCQSEIVKEIKDYDFTTFVNYGKFYLNYNEYGRKKKCYSNLSSLKIGLFENNV